MRRTIVTDESVEDTIASRVTDITVMAADGLRAECAKQGAGDEWSTGLLELRCQLEFAWYFLHLLNRAIFGSDSDASAVNEFHERVFGCAFDALEQRIAADWPPDARSQFRDDLLAGFNARERQYASAEHLYLPIEQDPVFAARKAGTLPLSLVHRLVGNLMDIVGEHFSMVSYTAAVRAAVQFPSKARLSELVAHGLTRAGEG